MTYGKIHGYNLFFQRVSHLYNVECMYVSLCKDQLLIGCDKSRDIRIIRRHSMLQQV